MIFYVYVLVNPLSKIYIGQTNNLARRICEHNEPGFSGTLYTKKHPGPWVLFYKEEFQSRSEAMQRERQLKSFQGRKFVRSLLEE